MKQRKSTIYSVCALAILLVAGCGKKPAPKVPQAPPPPPPAPTASLSANPMSVQKGQPVQLTWSTTNATDVNIEGVGGVNASGTQSVTPQESTTYRLTARGPGGSQEATARVTVEGPVAAPPPSQQAADTSSDEQWLAGHVQDVFFDYDSADISPEAQRTIQANVQALGQRSTVRVTIEGHCDERGSTEYNLALGESRAAAVRSALTAAGMNASRINTISYGKEKPQCTEASESCWQKNRRGHFTITK